MNVIADSTLVLENGLILRDPSTSEPERHERTLISGDIITAVNSHRLIALTPGQVIDCTDCLIMPGLVNSHVHSAMSLFRGLADDLPLKTWLEEFIFPCESRHVSPEMVLLGSTLSAIEMALSGVTTFADAYFFMEAAAHAVINVGLRAVIAQGVIDFPTPDARTTGSWKDRAFQFFESVPSHSNITPALFCHSPYLCGTDTYLEAAGICKSHNTKLFSHVAETFSEVQQTRSKYNVTPVEFLYSAGVLDSSFVAVHCVHLTARDREILRETGVGIVHCPESNMKLASGTPRMKDLLERGLPIGLGTDGAASNNNLDLFEEMRSASLMAKLVSNDPEAVTAREALTMATIGGARVLGLDHMIGTLDPGKQADIIIVDLRQPHLEPLYNPISQLVYCARGSDVRDVIIAGRQIVRNHSLCAPGYDDFRKLALDFAAKIATDTGKKLFLT